MCQYVWYTDKQSGIFFRYKQKDQNYGSLLLPVEKIIINCHLSNKISNINYEIQSLMHFKSYLRFYKHFHCFKVIRILKLWV